jgi:hypothetical protein
MRTSPFPPLLLPLLLALAGVACVARAVYCERRMHRYRQPGVDYWQATLRRDGGWRRDDLFTPEGLALQREAARFGWLGAALWILALGAWIALA